VLRSLRLLNTFWVYVVPPIPNVYAMLVMMTYFRSIPESLVESAMVEGASYFRILFLVILPLSRPMLAAMSLFAAVWDWNDWFSGFFYVSNINLQALQNFLQRVLESMTRIAGVSAALEKARGVAVSGSEICAKQLELTYKSPRMAVIMITVLPILLVYPLVQRHFTKGVLVGSIKE
jgi:putative aldouronate transport system permease protein